MGKWGLRQKCDRLRDESGQSIILISVLILSFLMFFSFAVNTGLLINAKISVQNAADAAAYAGAAVQARQLNAISFLNYDMRREYKRFLFRYAFVGSIGSPNFPLIPAGATTTPNTYDDYPFYKFDYSVGNLKNVIAIKVPVICIPLTSAGTKSDNCKVTSLPSTVQVVQNKIGGTGIGSIETTLINGLQAVEGTQTAICSGQGDINLLTALLWLFRTNETDDSVTNMATILNTLSKSPGQSPQLAQVLTNLSPLFKGLGLFPRNIISLMRIQNVASLLNQAPATGLLKETADGWISSKSNVDAHERTLQAFSSALANLNDEVFDFNLLQMDEMQSAQQINVATLSSTFNTYIQVPYTSTVAPAATGPLQGICQSRIASFPVVDAPIGVYLDGTSNVNYAVHLKAFVKPHGLLYLPNSDALELDAYAGAKPFGSRIGNSSVRSTDLVKSITPYIFTNQSNTQNDPCGGVAKCNVPILPVGGPGANGNANGAETLTYAYLQKLSQIGVDPSGAYSTQSITNAETHALLPNPQEIGHFNVVPPVSTDASFNANEFIPYFNAATNTSTGYYRFYAPVYAQGKGDVTTQVNSILSKMFDAVQVGNNSNGFSYNGNDMKLMLASGMITYINSNLASGSTTSGETTTFASVPLPIPSAPAPSPSPAAYWLTKGSQVRSSWMPASEKNQNTPRFGYSVKFVTLQNLMQNGVSSQDDDVSNVAH